MPTICLNMIVKNESKIITRLLESVVSLIDTYCICDTGSTDNTKELITTFFNKHNIKGVIFDEPFHNFQYNRNVALEHCWKLDTDYILLMDADMVLDVKPNFNKKDLVDDSYDLLQGSNDFQYYNKRIIRNKLPFKYQCVTHEYIDCPPKSTSNRLSTLFIKDIGDGGSKSDKFKRDIRLLTQGLIDEPKNIRYLFYLANSYFDDNQTDKAIEYYEKRIKAGSWFEEVWYSYYRLGQCYERKKEMEKAIYNWLLAYEFYPKRSENIFKITRYYREQRKNNLCYFFYKLGKSIPYPSECSLFIEKNVYDYLFDYEYSIIAYYLNETKNLDMTNVYTKLFNLAPQWMTQGLLQNYQFYVKQLQSIKTIQLKNSFFKTINGHRYTFVSSTPSIVQHHDPNFPTSKYVMNLRHVNYKINSDGVYPSYDHIVTYNQRRVLDESFNVLHEKMYENMIDKRLYIGIEDIKLFSYKGHVIYTGTIFQKHDKIGIGVGIYNDQVEKLEYDEIKSPVNAECEKNWVFFNHNDKLRLIYKWYPLTIASIKDSTQLDIIEKRDMPIFFHIARGSTNGFEYNNEIWFIVHGVYYNKPRDYYHSIVVFDKDMNLKKYTNWFKFQKQKIEYCIGLIVEENRIITTYSTWDRVGYISTYDKNYINDLLVNVPNTASN